MIHYHGGPVTPHEAARALWARRHAMVSFYHPDQIALAAEVCQSFVLDNGAFSAWKDGAQLADWSEYVAWVNHWGRHPGCDWAVIPDVIDGDEAANDDLLDFYRQLPNGDRQFVILPQTAHSAGYSTNRHLLWYAMKNFLAAPATIA